MVLKHVLGIMLNPSKEWLEIRDENTTMSEVYLQHVLFLAAIPPICAFIGATQLGWIVGDNVHRLTAASTAPMAFGFYLASLLGVYVMGRAIFWMSETYGAGASLDKCVVLSAYMITPMFVCGLIALFPVPWIILVVGLVAVGYTVYLIYTGIPIVMGIDKDQGFLFASAVLTVGLCTLVGVMASTVILWGLGLGPQYA